MKSSRTRIDMLLRTTAFSEYGCENSFWYDNYTSLLGEQVAWWSFILVELDDHHADGSHDNDNHHGNKGVVVDKMSWVYASVMLMLSSCFQSTL